MVGQHYISTGPMYRVIWVVAFLATGEESVTRIAIPHTECWFVVWPSLDMLDQHEATLVNRPVVAVDAGVEV